MMDGANCLPFFQESEIEGPARRNRLPDGLCHGLGQGGRLWSWLGRQRDFLFLGTWQRCVFTRFCPEKKCNKKLFMSIIAMNSKGRKIKVIILSWKVFAIFYFLVFLDLIWKCSRISSHSEKKRSLQLLASKSISEEISLRHLVSFCYTTYNRSWDLLYMFQSAIWLQTSSVIDWNISCRLQVSVAPTEENYMV